MREAGPRPGLFRDPHGAFFDRTAFRWNAETDRLICPAGKQLKPQATPQGGAIVSKARRTDCAACPLKARCPTAERRSVTPPLLDEAALERVSARLNTTPELMSERAQSVEPAFATLERWMHISYPKRGGRFLLRGKARATTEIKRLTLAFDLERPATIHGSKRLLEALARGQARAAAPVSAPPVRGSSAQLTERPHSHWSDHRPRVFPLFRCGLSRLARGSRCRAGRGSARWFVLKSWCDAT